MSEIDEIGRIRRFLGAMRRRLLLRAVVQTAGFGAGAMLLTLIVLGACAAALGPAGFWPLLTASVLGVMALAAFGYGVWRPARGLRSDRAAACAVAQLYPPVSSDLVSAVELDGHLTSGAHDPGAGTLISPSMIRAFHGDVARAVDPLDPKTLITMRPARIAVATLFAAAALMLGATRIWPALLEGMRTLIHRPTLFEGAAVSDAPLVGDVRIVYRYPAYTGLPPRTVEGSTGDIVAIKGTDVRIETRPLRSARRALLLLGEDGERGQVEARMRDGQLTAELKVMDSGTYRFWLSPLLGRPVREQRGHRLQADADAPPRVEIFGPADRLELPGPRPIEIGFTADDDYGIGNVELCYRIGNQPEQRQLLRDARGARNAQGRTIWDPAQSVGGIGLGTGERIAYRIEARDRDEISGAKSGSSRTLYLVIQNPRASIEERLDRQREVLEKLTDALGERLEKGPAAREGSAAPPEPPTARLTALQTMHDIEESHLALLGRLLDDDRREANLSKALRSALGGVADRLGRLLRDESALLVSSRGKPLAASGLARLEAASDKQVAELEKDVLLLDDLIGRQRLEDLANLGRELTDAHQRLQDLLDRYKATKDEALRRQLEREARELRARIADLAQKIAALKARNDVPEEWRNMPEMKELAEKAKKFDELIEQGDDRALSKALSELGENLKNLRQMLDQNAEGFGSERFPQENRVVAELMKKIGELEGDERSLQKDTQGLSEKQEAEVERRLKGQMDEFLKRENEKVERLSQRLGGIPTGGPESALAEEVDRARDSAKQMKRLLAERDLAEAKGEAERAESSLDRASEHLGEDEGRASSSKRADRKAAAGRGDPQKVAASVDEARTLAQEIADDLGKLLPRPHESLSPEEREQARAQAERQGAIGNRTDETAGEAARRLGKLPGLEKAEAELKSAAARMRQAAEMLKKSETKQASGAQRDAADRLAKLRDSMQERSMGTGKQQRDPVRIPGADESSAPRAWRQELMEAMKEKAPERYRDEVRRYYEELVR
ncbi:MAG TPA: DUF4175 family protein [Polyangia bacterium]|jgi:hypothetical protein|nr:DUF4175 family protein [Polyangia bacterium]